ncbi:VWA domain-containing protein [Halorubellus sp. JP-L1]|uniref:vWA domain-containing protein n=1 Tax=Halorubellus sp. JP-L1 TaxID=2715753 RepID=UPI00140B6646|nr:vWA domain-containing protein [Halorubellus sp. JP-L1]NHN40075.1 VWA domain-containing protein [Halorubellus sp. JP-L1]
MYQTRHSSDGTDNRAASALVGLVLLFGLVIAGAGIIFWAGMDAQQSVQSTAEVDTAETSLQEVSSTLSTLSFKGDDSVTEFDLSGKDSSDASIENDGEVQFTVHGLEDSCSADVDLGSIVYETDDGGTVAYQAGGVFKQTESGTTIVQSPSLQYRTRNLDGRELNTLQFPVTNVSGDVDSSGTVTAETAGGGDDALATELCLAGENTDQIQWVQSITITVEGSDYQAGWKRYFEREFVDESPDHVSATVVESGDEVSVTAPLGAGVIPEQFPVDDATIYGGMMMGSSSGTIDVQAGNPSQADVDSYDSTDGPYPVSKGKHGHVLTRGNVEITANSGTIEGTVVAEGDVEFSGGACGNGDDEYCIDGDVYHDGTIDESPSKTLVNGTKTNSATLPDLDPMDDRIELTIDVTEDDNHNDRDDVTAIDADSETLHAGDVTLSDGVYHLQELTVADGDTLTLDASSGDVVIAVEDGVTIEGDVEVEGDGQVRTFVGADSDHVTVGEDASVTVRDADGDRTHRSNAFWLVCKAGCQATFEGSPGASSDGAEFTGVVYGPGGTGNVELQTDSEVYGALVAGTVTFDQAYFHLDQGLPSTAVDVDGDGDPDLGGDAGDEGGDDGDGPDEFECSETDDGYDCSVTYDEDENALVVNQSQAEVTLLGSRIAEPKLERIETDVRNPMNISLVIDDSGSMNHLTNYGKYNDGEKTYEHVSGAHSLWSYSSWSPEKSVSAASYASAGEDGPAAGSNEQWEVTTESCIGGFCWSSTETLNPGETAELEPSDTVQKRTFGEETTTVPEGYAYVGDDDGDGDIEGDIPASRVYYPGETISGTDHDYYHEIRIDGNDPSFERLDAAQQFVGAMNDTKDRLSVVRFWGVEPNEQAQTKISQSSDFGAVNGTLDTDAATWESSSGTPMLKALNAGISDVETDKTRDDGKNVTETVVLLTDGRPSDDSAANLQAIRDAASAAHENGIRIYVVALGDEGDYNKALLEDIANVDGENPDRVGKVYEVDNADDLSETFQRAANDSQESTRNVIEYKNTTTSVNVGGSDVDFGSNTNDPTDTGYTSIPLDSALDPGDLVHFAVSTRTCADYENLGAVNDTSDVQETRCAGTNGTANQTTHDSETQHKIYTNGDDVPELDASAWYVEERYDETTVEEIVEAYDPSITNGDTFSLPENDAIVVVEVDDGDSGTPDFMVLYFDASTYDPDEDDAPDGDEAPDDDDTGSTDGTRNGYVIDVGSKDVNVSSSDPRVLSGNPSLGSPTSSSDDSPSWPPRSTQYVNARD